MQCSVGQSQEGTDMKKFLILVLALAISVPALAHAPKSLDATHRIEIDTVVMDPDTGKPEPDNAICSATAVGPHALLTAQHCDRIGQGLLTVDDKVAVIQKRLFDGNDHEILIVDETFDVYADFEHTNVFNKGDDV